mgnify:CR=1 FL=1|jgi:cell division protein FtsB
MHLSVIRTCVGIFIAISLYYLVILFWGSGGFSDLRRLEASAGQIQTKQTQVELTTERIKERISFDRQPEVIEEQARSEYGMVLPSEKVIPFSG